MKGPFGKGVFYDTVTVGERGQIVIPAKARRDFGIKPKDKLFVLQGVGKMGMILVNSKQMSHMFNKLISHIGQIKKLLSRRG